MTRIAVVGGHGKVALLLARQLGKDGHDVTSIVRNPDHIGDVEETGASAQVADVEKLGVDEIADLLSGHDAVVWSAGAGGGDADRTFAVDRDAANRTVDAAEKANVRRFVMVSYLGAGQDHGVPKDNSFYAYAQAKADADDHVRASTLDWTIVGPGKLTLDDPSGKITVVDGKPEGDADTSRANVALVVAEVLADPSTAGSTIEFTDGDTPVAEAISAGQ